MNNNELADKSCAPCDGSVPALAATQLPALLAKLNNDWSLINEGSPRLVRRYRFKGFAKAVYLSNLCAWLADQQGHHPDIAYGWGYCEVTLSTHDINGLTENDFIWAAKLDRLTA